MNDWDATYDTGELAGDILANVGDEWDLDQSIESIAIEYVRHLEAEVKRLGGRLSRWGGPGYVPNEQDIAEWQQSFADHSARSVQAIAEASGLKAAAVPLPVHPDVCDRCGFPAVQRADGQWEHAEYADAVFCGLVYG
jgi:hypothetical protein